MSMFFPDEGMDQPSNDPPRIIYIYDNSNPQNKPYHLQITKKTITFKQLSKILNINQLRLFNSEGAEYFEDDFKFIKNKTALYASRGEDFDPCSCFGQYEIIEKLGEGGFGKVYLAKHKQTKQNFAIKIIKTEKINSAAEIDSIFSEVEVLKSLRHQNIVKVHNCLTLKNMQVAIIMEYLEGGQLLKYVEKQKRLNQQKAKIFFKQLVKGMNYCHQNNLIHRDLKLENLLLVNTQDFKIKIIDFGIAGVVNFFTWEDMDTGSLAYMAPECFINSKNYKVDGRIDVWAIGVILYGMLVGDLPFKGSTTLQTVQSIKEGKYKIPFEIEKTLSKQCLNVLRKCLNVDYRLRPTMQQLLQDPWISQKMITEQQIKAKLLKILEIPNQQNEITVKKEVIIEDKKIKINKFKQKIKVIKIQTLHLNDLNQYSQYCSLNQNIQSNQLLIVKIELYVKFELV